ncbi:alpha/beta fold hydrolase [Tropicimonas sp. IMCC34043]|uniref:alpha/beta fold hydrolase n=1 Tax=Tropicimonas sp. IMCC34043 TaxID=2248760 RepID=UPI000E273858|nr:alpha/beta hydrolase [Tropicimonas sp. IMCC34043]
MTGSKAEQDYPPEGEFLTIDGRRLHVLVQGSGPDVVLIHGASGNLRDFTYDLVDRLVPRYRVIAVDRPGLGHSDRLHDDGESPAEQAAVLDRAAAMLGVERAVVVGHSYGGAVALSWALDHPDRVAAVVSLAGAAMPWPGELGPWYRVASTGMGGATLVPMVAALLPSVVVRRLIGKIFSPQDAPAGYADHVGVDLSLQPDVLRANVRQVGTLKDHLAVMAPRYPTLRLPIEILQGTADTIVPAVVHARPLREIAPDARLTELPGVGHMLHHVDPAATVAAIDNAARRGGLN